MKRKALTTHEIAKYCEVAPRTIFQWINEGKIKAFKTPGNHCRVQVYDFIKFLKEYEIPIPNEFKEYLDECNERKILIVDDDKNMARSIERVLTMEGGYRLELAFDGFDAGRKVVMFNPEIVILDIKMPGMDGYEVAKKIRETEGASEVKIIAISAFFDNKCKDKMQRLGVRVCLDKPFDKKDLLDAIKETINN